MTYQEAWKTTQSTNYQTARGEGWGDEWQNADEFIRIADYDFAAGIIAKITDYDL